MGVCVGVAVVVGVAVASGVGLGIEVDAEPHAAATKPKTSIREIHPALLTNDPPRFEHIDSDDTA